MGDDIWGKILPIVGGIVGSFIAPGIGTAIGSGLGSLVGGAISGPPDGVSHNAMNTANQGGATGALSKAPDPMNRTVYAPGNYNHGVNKEWGFFSHFDEGGPVLPVPMYNKPINPNGIGAMQQYFPGYTPSTGPDWQAIANSSTPVRQPVRPVVSQQAVAFDPMMYGRADNGVTPTPTPTPTTPTTPAATSQDPIVSGALNQDYYPYGYDPIWLPDRSYGFAEGGEVYADDGGGDPVSVYQKAVAALRGLSAHPEDDIAEFIANFGQPALMKLRTEIAGDISGRMTMGMSPSTGMSDSVPAMIDGKQPASLSEGEYVVPADAVSALGDGSTKAGARRMDEMVSNIRNQAHGKTTQQRQVNPAAI